MPDVAEREAVGEADAAGPRHADQRVAQGREIGDVQATLVDPPRAARHDRDARGGAEHDRIQLGPGLGVVLLGIVERGQRPDLAEAEALVVEQHRGGNQRPRQAPAARLVRTGHEPHPEIPIEGEEPARREAFGAAGHDGGHHDRRPGGTVRGARCGPAASTSRTPRR